MNSAHLQGLARWRFEYAHRGFWLVFMSLSLLLTFSILLLRSNAEDPHVNYVETHKALSTLVQPHVPDEENAALKYQNAFATFAPFSGTYEENPDNNLSRDSKFFEYPRTIAYLASNKQMLSLLEIATVEKRCNWNLNYFDINRKLNTPYYNLLQGAQCFCVRARVRAHTGDHFGAAEDLRRVRAMASHLTTDKLILNTLIANNIQRVALETLQAIVVFDMPSRSAEIEAYRRALKCETNPHDEFLMAMKTETLFTADSLDRASLQDEAMLRTVSIAWKIPRSTPLIFNILYGCERKTQRAIMGEIETSARKGAICASTDELLLRHQHGPALMMAKWIACYKRSQLDLVNRANIGLCADTALAVMHFRCKNGRDPENLAELVPEFIPSIPLDWFNRKPLKLLKDNTEIDLDGSGLGSKPTTVILPPGSFRIHTFGQNGVDNGGHAEYSTELRKDSDSNSDDEVFFLPPLKK